MDRVSRRGFLTAAGGTLAVAWLAADREQLLAAVRHARRAIESESPPPFEFLTPEDAAELEAATAQIIPSDDTPGAREARVVHFIDKALATWQQGQRDAFAKGVAELRARAATHGARSFASLSAARQHAVIASLEKDKHEFFDVLRAATIMGMLASPSHGGNFDKIGWRAIGFDDRFAWTPPYGWYDANER